MIILRESLGDVEKVVGNNKLAWGSTLRVRVYLNVNKPIRRAYKVMADGGRSASIWFRYEKLLDFYYTCGVLNNQELNYPTRIQL